MEIKIASASDVDLLIRLRFDYLLADRGALSALERGKIETQMRGYIPAHIGRNFIAAIAVIEDEPEIANTGDYIIRAPAAYGGTAASCAFIAVSERPAHPAFISGRVGTLMNVLTYPAYRRRGFASAVVSTVLEEARKLGVSSAELYATSDGQPMYSKMGFKPNNHTAMRMLLKAD